MLLTDAPSRTPDAPYRSAARLDPFYDYVWSRGSTAQWRSCRQMLSRQRSGLRRAPAWFTPTADEQERALTELHTKNREEKLAVLAAVDEWRTVTVEQLAAITGIPLLAIAEGRIIRELYALGLVDIGCFEGFTDRAVTNTDVREWLVRPSRTTRYDELVAPRLTWPESVRLTGGRKFTTGGQYDRHNILAVELGLRVAEFTDCASVAGEKYSGQSDLLFDGWGRPDPYPQLDGRGDLTLIRSDGMRVVVEMTASAKGEAFQRKVNRWVQQLAVGSLADQGTVVLFVSCGDQAQKRGDKTQLHNFVRRSVLAAVKQFPGNPGVTKTLERIFVAEWGELFPGAGELHDDFAALPVKSPLGFGKADEQLWQPANLFDPQEWPYRPSADPMAFPTNLRALVGTPWWLRHGGAPQIAMDAVRALWPSGIPGLTAAHTKAKGSAGQVTLPPRLVL